MLARKGREREGERKSENESAGIDTTSSTKISGGCHTYGGSRNHAGRAVMVFLNN
jgi:hypothetical protein